MQENTRIESGVVPHEQHGSLPIALEVVDGQMSPCLLEGESRSMWMSRVRAALGTESDDLVWYVLCALYRASKKPEGMKLNAMLAQIREGQPRDVQEMILLAQMAATNQRLQEALTMQIHDYDAEDALVKAKIVAQYGRLYDHQLEALRKYRRTGDQTITIVHSQKAIVGIKTE